MASMFKEVRPTVDPCPKCGQEMGDDYRFHLVASPNAGSWGQIKGFPRLSIHREHIRLSNSWEWEVICKVCYQALPCAPVNEPQRPLDNA
jgi:hypothetical protein